MGGSVLLVARRVHPEHRPCGSRSTAIRRTSAMDVGSMRAVPPASVAVAAVASTSATEKYGSQCGGTSGGNFASIVIMPPKSAPSMPHCG